MNEKSAKVILWVSELSFGITSLCWLLSKLGASPRQFLLLAILSAGTLLLIEAAILCGWISELQVQMDETRQVGKEQSAQITGQQKEIGCLDDLHDLQRQLLRRRNWFLRAGASFALTSVAFISFGSYPSLHAPGDHEITVQFSNGVETAAAAYLAKLSASNDMNNGRDPQQGEHKEFLGLSSMAVLIVVVLALSALIGIIFWTLTRKPEATPLTVAIATLTAIAGLIGKLNDNARMPPLHDVSWLILIVTLMLLVLGAALLFEGWWCLFGLRRFAVGASPHAVAEGGRDTTEKRSLLGAALLIFGFSAALLALVPPMLFVGEVSQTAQSRMDSRRIKVFSLNRIDGLADGRRPEDRGIALSKVRQLTDDLSNKGAEPGDTLLLLGSADCVPTRPKGPWKDNGALAEARAGWVKNSLDGQMAVNGIRIEIRPLPEQGGCGPAPNVRAVSPFLIRKESE